MKKKVTRKIEICDIISRKTDVHESKIKTIIDLFTETVKTEVQKGKIVQINGFGSFTTKTRKKTKVTNFKTGEKYDYPEITIPYFKPSPAWPSILHLICHR